MSSINWNQIITINNSQNEGFEEFVCQLAKSEFLTNEAKFIRIGKPDGGRECEIVFPDNTAYHFQAKFFTSTIDDSQFSQITKSVKSDIEHFNNVKKYYIAFATDLPDVANGKSKSCMDRWNENQKEWEEYATNKGKQIKFIRWDSSAIITLLTNKKNEGLRYFFFGNLTFPNEWFIKQNEKSIADLQDRYTPSCNIDLEINATLQAINESSICTYHFNQELKELKGYYLNTLQKVAIAQNEIKDFFEKSEKINFKEYNNFHTDYNELLENWTIIYNIINAASDNKEKTFLQYFWTRIWNLLNSPSIQLYNSPLVLLKGIGGAGKSHLLANTVTQFSEKGHNIIFLLGQNFQTSEPVWIQLLRILECSNYSSETFLTALDAKAFSDNTKILFIIDAINESFDIGIWKRNFRSFINDIKKYPNLGLIFSLRNEYENHLVPLDTFSDLYRIEHDGYNSQEELNTAIKGYKEFYNVELPSDLTFIINECKNPLFLKVLFKSYRNSKIPEGIIKLPELFGSYISQINNTISETLQCPKDLNIVNKFIKEYILLIISKSSVFVSVDEANEISLKLEKDLNLNTGIIQQLYSQGLFYKSFIYSSENKKSEFVFMEYDKLQNFFIANYCCKLNIEDIKQKESFFKSNDALTSMFFYLYYTNYKFDFDHFDLSDPLLFSSFIASFEYRKINDFGKNIDSILDKAFVGQNVLLYLSRAFYELKNGHNIIGISKLLEKVISIPQSKRDSLLIPFFMENYYQFSDLWTLVNLYSEKNNLINSNNTENICIILSLVLLSSNRELRDNSTKSLIFLLQGNSQLLYKLLKTFESIDDSYITERLLAATYGCVLRTENIKEFKIIAEYIYENFFVHKYFIYPHILIRDYARNIIEFLQYKGINIKIKQNNIKPPYRSLFPILLPSIKNIDKKYGNNMITSSMTTEYGRGMSRYGDFGRYVFQSALQNWDVDYDRLSNWCIKKIYTKYKYSKENNVIEFDKKLGTGRHQYSKENERIGKKYQWQMFFEVLARVADNKRISTKHYSSIHHYDGAWNPYVRDIDPSLLIKYTKGNESSSWWNSSCNPQWNLVNWEENIYDLPNIKNLLIQKSEAENWFLLDGLITWKENDTDVYSRRISYKISSYIAKEEELSDLLEEMKANNFNEEICPAHSELYQVFSREYFWSPAYKSFCNDYYLNSEEYEITLKSGKAITYFPTTDSFLWENEYDYSKTDLISFKNPSRFIFENMNLEYSIKEGEFLHNGEMVCFDPSVNNKIHSGLFIKADLFKSFLKKNKLKIAWVVKGEKYSAKGYSTILGQYVIDTYGNIKGDLILD